jgi:hypothetical protein
VVLAHVLQKMGKTRDEMEQEMSTLGEYDKYTKPQAVYVCQAGKAHECAAACETLDQDWDVETPPEGSDLEVIRGICCRAKWPDDADEWCSGCALVKKVKRIE